jgi:hypothetical protein
MTQRPSSFAFGGGLDQVSAALAAPAGRVIAALNYEPLAEGYGRVDGFERYDGRLPSESTYSTLAFDAGTVAIAEGAEIRGATSDATATVLVDPASLTGSWDDGDAAGTLVLAGIDGTFQDNEQLLVAGVPHALAAGASAEGGGTGTDDATWTEAAQTWMREQVGEVPGDGPVRGVAFYDGSFYAIRDNELGTRGIMYRATAAGWVALSFGTLLTFTAGVVEIAEGATIVGGTSLASAVVERVVKRDGDWGTDASGYIVLSAQIGVFQAETIKVSGTDHATIAGDSSAINLPVGGTYSFKNKNFYGAADDKRLYFVNGVGYAHEFDGTVLAPIVTGMEDNGHSDTPDRIFDIANMLGLVFPGGSVQLSAIGEPLLYNVLLGASEIALGDDCTDVRDSNDSAVVFYCREKVMALTGRDADSFQLEELTEEAGAEAWTVQRMAGRTLFLDRRGLRDLSATQAYGNFKVGALSELFEPYLKKKRKDGATPVFSLRCKTKGHYRLFWSDMTGFNVFLGRKLPEMLPFDLGGKMQPYCGTACELDDGTEGLFVGAEDGYVYRLDSGTSCDGDGVRAFAMAPFNHVGSPRVDKRFHGVDVELVAAPTTRIAIAAQFDYGNPDQPTDNSQDFDVSGGGGFWDLSNWNEFYWSSPFQGTAQADIDGFGRNVGIVIIADSAVTEEPHILQSYSIYWSPAGVTRRVA